jgi:hypothetical protein
VPPLLLGLPFFPNSSFWVHHPVNGDDRHLLAHAMAFDFSVTRQLLSKRTIVVFIMDQTPFQMIKLDQYFSAFLLHTIGWSIFRPFCNTN